MANTKRYLALPALALLIFSPSSVLAAVTCTGGVTPKPGILVAGTCPDWTFWNYVSVLLGTDGIGVYVLTAAVIMIVFSGVEYMMGANSDGQKKAKERIRGILTGVAFYAVVLIVLRLISTQI